MMTNIAVNYLAVLVAAIASMVIGFVWYGPLFGKIWMRLSGINPGAMTPEMKSKMTTNYIIALIGSFVGAYVLAHFVGYLAVTTIAAAATLAFWIWLGFFATTMLSTVLWEMKPWGLYFLNIAYHLVNLIVMASILAIWH